MCVLYNYPIYTSVKCCVFFGYSFVYVIVYKYGATLYINNLYINNGIYKNVYNNNIYISNELCMYNLCITMCVLLWWCEKHFKKNYLIFFCDFIWIIRIRSIILFWLTTARSKLLYFPLLFWTGWPRNIVISVPRSNFSTSPSFCNGSCK